MCAATGSAVWGCRPGPASCCHASSVLSSAHTVASVSAGDAALVGTLHRHAAVLGNLDALVLRDVFADQVVDRRTLGALVDRGPAGDGIVFRRIDRLAGAQQGHVREDRKSTRLNSSH